MISGFRYRIIAEELITIILLLTNRTGGEIVGTNFFSKRHICTHDRSSEQFEREPNVTHEFDVEKCFVRIGTVLAEYPLERRVLAGGWWPIFGYRDVPQCGHSKVGMGFQRKRQHGHTYKKH